METALSIFVFVWLLVISRAVYKISADLSQVKAVAQDLTSKVRGLSLVVKVMGARRPD
jgi:hypothetical protein